MAEPQAANRDVVRRTALAVSQKLPHLQKKTGKTLTFQEVLEIVEAVHEEKLGRGAATVPHLTIIPAQKSDDRPEPPIFGPLEVLLSALDGWQGHGRPRHAVVPEKLLLEIEGMLRDYRAPSWTRERSLFGIHIYGSDDAKTVVFG